MKALILALIPIVAVAIGVVLGKRARPPVDQQQDRAELLRLRKMREQLINKAAEHAVLGDDFAVIALGILNPEEKPHG